LLGIFGLHCCSLLFNKLLSFQSSTETLLKTIRVRPFIFFQNLWERVYDFAKSQEISYQQYLSTNSTRIFCFKHFYWQVFKEGFDFFTLLELEGKNRTLHTHTHTHPVCISEFINKNSRIIIFLNCIKFWQLWHSDDTFFASNSKHWKNNLIFNLS
jgi:hypothetical protein